MLPLARTGCIYPRCMRCMSASRIAGGPDILHQCHSTWLKRCNSTQSSSPPPTSFGKHNIPRKAPEYRQPSKNERGNSLPPIRERLPLWALENENATGARNMPPDAAIYGSIANNMSRTQATGSSELDQLRDTPTGIADDTERASSEDADMAILGTGSIEVGDLVELRQAGSRVPVFAVYLGYSGERNHFYAVNGKWIVSMSFSSLFTVSNFASMAELEPILAKIPQDATPELFDELRCDEKGPSREDGTLLIDRMAKFRAQSELIYQSNLAKLDGARSLVAATRNVQCLSLFDIAGILLPESLKGEQGYRPYALYAVHCALYQNEVGFSPLSASAACHRRDHLFEVLPQNHSIIVSKIAAWVRQYTDSCAKRLRPLNDDELNEVGLGRFILQSREAVLQSRQTRQWTKHGILKDSSGATIQGVEWSPVSKDVLQFLEWWASYGLFDAGSRFHSYGAIILRSLDMYKDVALDQSTAWTFLQEVGIIAPWEIPSRYRVRFPGTSIDRGGGITRPGAARIDKSTRGDIAAGKRKARSDQTIFCIDAPSTVIIDDGISLERTERPDEFWIHIHAADPASVIQPNSELCKFMELIPENIYLPGHFQAMLPSDLGESEDGDYKSESLVEQFSLRSGVPALTFSAKVNEAGDILDYAIEPSTLGDVRYLDPDDVSNFCDEPAPPALPEAYSFEVGTPPKDDNAQPNREMTPTKALDNPSKADLLTLYRLSVALKQKRLLRGAWPYFFPRPSVQVSFHQTRSQEGDIALAPGVKILPQEPYIKVGMESSSGCAVVSNLMVLAGEIAAKWCSSRGIPLPYRRDTKSSQNYLAALDYATREVYPLIDQGKEPTASHRQELSKLTGSIEISTEPGPYFLLGLDKYAKATSPLRRFSDLIVHWQIHAALAHERQTGRQMDRASAQDITLPFTYATLRDETLPLLQTREKMARAVSRGTRDWMLMALVRAWKFEKTAPSRFKFTVSSRWRQGLLGRLDMFDLPAAMDVSGLGGRRLIKDVRVGDTFEVELADVNVHSQQILVTALR